MDKHIESLSGFSILLIYETFSLSVTFLYLVSSCSCGLSELYVKKFPLIKGNPLSTLLTKYSISIL